MNQALNYIVEKEKNKKQKKEDEEEDKEELKEEQKEKQKEEEIEVKKKKMKEELKEEKKNIIIESNEKKDNLLKKKRMRDKNNLYYMNNIKGNSLLINQEDINGKTLDRSGKEYKTDGTKYSKDYFSKYVVSHYSEIDFSGFEPLLVSICEIIQD